MRAVRTVSSRCASAFVRAAVDAIRGASRLARAALTFAETWLTSSSKSLYGLSVARMGFGVCALGLLVANFSTRYYTFGTGVVWSGERIFPVSDFAHMPLFSIFYDVSMDDGVFTLLYVLLMIISVVVILGYRMKVTLPVFGILFVGFLEMTDFVGDQGDNIFRMALISMLFMDTSARWSLDARRRRRFQPQFDERPFWWAFLRGARLFPSWIRNTAHNLGLVVIVAQVSFIYVAGALYKAGGTPWASGQAIYAPLHVDRFGTWPGLSDLLTAWDPAVGILTYGALLTQLAFPFLLLNRWTRKIGIISITGVHIGIGILMGLPFFSLTMISLDMLFVSDRTWSRFAAWSRGLFVDRPSETTPAGRPRSPEAASVPERVAS